MLRAWWIYLGLTVLCALGPTPSSWAQSNQQSVLELARQLKNSADTNDAPRFVRLVPIYADLITADPTLSAADKLTALGALAVLSQPMMDPTAQITAHTAILEYAEGTWGTQHEATIAARARLMMALAQNGRLQEAADIAAGGPTSPDGRSIAGAILATQLLEQGRYADAVRLLETERRQDVQLMGHDAPERTHLLLLLAQAHLGLRDGLRAVETLTPALEWAIQGRVALDDALMIRMVFGQALSLSGRTPEAIAVLDRAHREAEQTLGPEHRLSLMLGLSLSNAYGTAGDMTAFQNLRLRQSRLATNAALQPAEKAISLIEQARTLISLGHHLQAQTPLNHLFELTAATPGLDPLIRLEALNLQADVLMVTDPRGGKTRRTLMQLAQGYQETLGPDHIETQRAQAAVLLAPRGYGDLSPQDVATGQRLLDQYQRTRRLYPVSVQDLAALRRFQTAVSTTPVHASLTDQDIAFLYRWVAAERARVANMSLEVLKAHTDLVRVLLGTRRYAQALFETDTLLADLAHPAAQDFDTARSEVLTLRAQALTGLGRHADAVASLGQAITDDLATTRWLEEHGPQALREGQSAAATLGWRYAEAAWAAAQAGSDQDRLKRQAFRASQISGFGPASRALTQATIRNRRSDPTFARALHDWETARRQAAAFAEISLDVPTQRPDLTLAQTENRVKALMPDVFDHLIPEPLDWAGTRESPGVRDLIGHDEALILIVPSPPALPGEEVLNGIVFAATRDRLAWARIDMPTLDLVTETQTLHAALDRRDPGLSRAPKAPGQKIGENRPTMFDATTAHNIYKAIFAAPELASLLADKPRWILVPQGPTMRIPFAALPMALPDTPLTTGDDLRRVRWLGLEKAISLLPSVTALRNRHTPPAHREKLGYVAFGDPVFTGRAGPIQRDANALYADRQGVPRAVRTLPRLPGTRREVTQLAHLFDTANSMIHLGPAASERSINDLAAAIGRTGRIGLLHFATHGILTGDFSGLTEPALALSPPTSGQAEPLTHGVDDGLLTASEIAQLRLVADWVILSACDTSGSADFGTSLDGLTGLVRAFLFAGARTLVVSHWRVQDDIAARLTTDTVRLAVSGLDRSEALRQAMVRVVQDTSRDQTDLPLSHPTVWAPFFLIGSDRQ